MIRDGNVTGSWSEAEEGLRGLEWGEEEEREEEEEEEDSDDDVVELMNPRYTPPPGGHQYMPPPAAPSAALAGLDTGGGQVRRGDANYVHYVPGSIPPANRSGSDLSGDGGGQHESSQRREDGGPPPKRTVTDVSDEVSLFQVRLSSALRCFLAVILFWLVCSMH